jgi:hypothetical protein
MRCNQREVKNIRELARTDIGWVRLTAAESLVEVEAANGVLYQRPMLRAVQLSSEVYSSCGGG